MIAHAQGSRLPGRLSPPTWPGYGANVCYNTLLSMVILSDVCHTAANLNAAHGNVQQPAHNLVAVTEPFLALHKSS